MTVEDSRIQAVRQLPLFASLPEEQLTQLAGAALYRRYGVGEIIFRRGDPGDRAYVILTGSIDLVIESADGRELILARLAAGEHFGEMALLDDLRRSASARVSSPAEVVTVLRRTFLQTLEDEPEVSKQIIRSLVQRLRSADDKIEAFAYLDAAGRIARTVLELEGKSNDVVRVSHEELAHMAATSRQTTTKILGEWEGNGFVTLSRRGIAVNDREALGLLAEL